MEPTQFLEYIAKYAPKLILKITDYLNDTQRERPYYHQRYLTPRYSVTGSWEIVNKYNKAIAADVIALDSSIPLKSNPSIEMYGGEIPKIAIEKAFNESDLRKLDLMMASNTPESQIIEFIFEHLPAVITGQYERHELNFLQGLSTGQILLTNADNVGTNVRVDFGYKAENKFNASVVWGQAGYTPLSDLERVVEKSRADGTPIRKFLIDRATFNLIRKSDEAKAYWNPLTANQPALSLDQLNSAVEGVLGFTFEIIERTVVTEINGKQTIVNPWEAGRVIGITREDLGALVYTDLAESRHPVAGVNYQKAGNNGYILTKQYRLVRPSLKEITASESMSLTVLSNVNEIYSLDSTATA